MYGAGCGHSAKTAKPGTNAAVLDYRNGWYHEADGKQSIEEIGRHYRRDAKLVAQLNSMSASSVAPKGKMLYIPPSNDRQYVRATLVRVQGKPELVPTIPWSPELVSKPRPAKIAAGKTPKKKIVAATKTITAPKTVVAEKAVDAPASHTSQSAFGWPHRSKSGGRFVWPVQGEIVTRFREGWDKACHGLEISVPEGSPVRAARDGLVLLATELPGYGNVVLIDHRDGYVSVYGYNSRILVNQQSQVHTGDKIAMVGHSRTSDSGMLFFQIRRNGQAIDPLEFLE